MATLTTVKVERGKLIELLTEAKQQALARHAERVTELEEERTKSLDVLRETATAFLAEATEQTVNNLTWAARAAEGMQNREARLERDRERIEESYDSALRLVEISSDDTHRIRSDTEFGRLLGL